VSPKVSIIVPVYNVEIYLTKCIESILNQSFDKFELILVNDGSIDKSGIICNKYAEKDIRIKVIHQKNQGLATARNTGINVSKGEYVGFVDSDDWIDPNMFKLLYESCERENADFSIIGIREVNEDGTKLREYIPKNITLSEILKRAHACNKIIKREIFIKNNLYFSDGRYYEDLELIPKLFVKSEKVTNVNICAYNYLKRSGSITTSRDEKILDNLWAYTEIKNFLIKEDLYSNYMNEFEKAVEYFRKYYINELYDYPTSFLLKNSLAINNSFNQIGGLHINDILKLTLKHINFSIRKMGSIQLNKMGRLFR
jgi:glycosyltransferase involved in cell wall biosynthesis